ncbi:amino acid ABC transporter permease [Neorhizobium sp. AL 9.2.2]|uniref:amino acid ABC transporter permease n=1 Tax=Neorhizobium sp. AL 9.2.2 TaxID=2712894 RepID=UPI00157420AA|nr:amino acid ABC transporter permease [Neorhizobium sp. AL 9.2.2]NSY18503.1 amino acid ABC transporter permease [Neorhizobium sp. AL 9.2.2]
MQQILDNYLNLEIMREAFPEVLRGFWVTVQASIAVIIIGLASGLALAICRCMRNAIIDCVITSYVEIFRTLPQLVVLIFLYFGLPYMGLTLSPFFATVFGLSAVLSAFSAEIFWASIVAVPRGQWEAASALGFKAWRTLTYIILPQAVRLALPLVTNRSIAITKGTALGVALSLQETLGSAQSIMSIKANPSPLTLAAFFYLLFFIPLVAFSRYVERRFSH